MAADGARGTQTSRWIRSQAVERQAGRGQPKAMERETARRGEKAVGRQTIGSPTGRRSTTQTPAGRRMIAHVVLFRPKTKLRDDQRRAFVTALEHALVNIPLIKRARVGRRLTVGRLYDRQNTHDFPFVAILEFDNEEDLRAYLEHPAHQMLGAQFYVTADAAFVFDYELLEGAQVRALLGPEA
jgi:hypothetical protein